jgi:hypothetical protein
LLLFRISNFFGNPDDVKQGTCAILLKKGTNLLQLHTTIQITPELLPIAPCYEWIQITNSKLLSNSPLISSATTFRAAHRPSHWTGGMRTRPQRQASAPSAETMSA